MNITTAQSERFWRKVSKDGPVHPTIPLLGPCWIWNATRSVNGYGMVRLNLKMRFAHRISWMISRGAIPISEGFHGTCVCHSCDNRACVNPSHLFLGTMADNHADRDSKGHLRVPFGSAHHHTSLTDADVLDIRSRYVPGEGLGALALKYGIGRQAIHKIVKRQTWKHLP